MSTKTKKKTTATPKRERARLEPGFKPIMIWGVPEDLHKWFKEHCVRKNISMTKRHIEMMEAERQNNS